MHESSAGKAPEKLAPIPSREEIARFPAAMKGVRNRAALATVYAAGLRITEWCAEDKFDRQQGRGRLVPLAVLQHDRDVLLACLTSERQLLRTRHRTFESQCLSVPQIRSPGGALHPLAEARGIPRAFQVNRECWPLPRMRALAGARLGIVLVLMTEGLDAALRKVAQQAGDVMAVAGDVANGRSWHTDCVASVRLSEP